MKMMIALVLFAMVSLAIEKTLSQGADKRGSLGDVLSSFSCRFLKINGYLTKNSNYNLRKLCLKTNGCKDILSKHSCQVMKAYNHCTEDYPASRKYCPFTCHMCGDPQCKVSVPLGMQSKAIPDSKITASTYWSSKYKPSNARLHMNSYGWCPRVNKLGEWLQVDLSKVTIISGIATQDTGGYWLKTYSLEYSIDGSTFQKYKAGKIFAANVRKNSVVKNDLNPHIHARYIRIYPKTWHSWAIFRMELYGCK